MQIKPENKSIQTNKWLDYTRISCLPGICIYSVLRFLYIYNVVFLSDIFAFLAVSLIILSFWLEKWKYYKSNLGIVCIGLFCSLWLLYYDFYISYYIYVQYQNGDLSYVLYLDFFK